MGEIFKDFAGLFVAGLGVIAWFFRLEARGISNTAAIKAQAALIDAAVKRMTDQRKEDLDSAKDSRREVGAQLSQIEADIKRLLEIVGRLK